MSHFMRSEGGDGIGIHFVCRDDQGVTVLSVSRFETRAWRVSEASARTVDYIALHQRKVDASYRQGRVISYRRDVKRLDRFVFVCEADDIALPWPGPVGGRAMMAFARR
jgi:hypothetical protein